MSVRVLFVIAALLGVYVNGSARAETPVPSRVTIVTRPDGQRSLLVDYPWKVHSRPSVEVRLVTGGDTDLPGVGPLFFVADYFKGKMTIAVHDSHDRSAGTPQSRKVTENELEFEILGRRNSLGRPSVCVVRQIPNTEPPPGTSAVFCLLPSWSVHKSQLCLDLPQAYFAQAGKLYVWFFREDKILWEETIDWPGTGKAKS